ncbi:MAG: hypothetical protein C0601_11935 [Candidatus Muiribacterium halophilum]|uniref:Cytosolic protein n=1 Tax=Muiribacterium halophilum TaxID=2053465 RepID=A0A2N5ZB34_MUIH1|nr:MAG: hypothetical protein C0601_11935 [Candidatus Muirbacterium halophilum]
MTINCENLQKNKDKCNCSYPCDKKGNCCDCIHYHRNRGELPACYFTAEQEKTYDRSIAYFIKCNS